MALSELQQATTILDQARHLLIIVPKASSPDAISSMIALFLSLCSHHKYQDGQSRYILDEVSPSHVPRSLQFLAGSSQVQTKPTGQPEIIVDISKKLNIKRAVPEHLPDGTRLHIPLPPKSAITKDQIEISIHSLPYNAVITIGASDLEELGQIFTQNVDFFYNTPIINIDHRAANEHFGTVNLVDITTGSNAEVVYDLIMNRIGSITPDIATALYAGLVAGTDAFQKPSTTPRSFQVAASLIEQDANREAVIQHLIKTTPLNIIKLLGSIYARLQHEEQTRLYWTSLEASDFIESGATADNIPAAMQELSNNIAGFNASFLLYEAQPPLQPTTNPLNHHPGSDSQKKHFYAYLILGKGLKQRQAEIQATLSANKENGALTFRITAPSIEAAEKTAHDKIRQILP